MAKFNVTDNRGKGRNVTSPVTTAPVPTAGVTTHEGAPAYLRDPRSELFLLAVANMVGEKTFYEDPAKRDGRFEALCREVAVADPTWLAGFVPWLRTEAYMRTASLVAAIEGADAMRRADVPGGRALVAAAMARGDEPGEAFAYWISRYGRPIPKPIKRGIADAAARLYNEYTLLKYDTPAHSVRFGDIVDMCQPKRTVGYKEDLYRYALDRRTGKNTEVPESLRMVWAQTNVRGEWARPDFDWAAFLASNEIGQVLRQAGLNWEDLIPRVPEMFKRAAWEALIPTMGYMALLRNLVNFDKVGISRESVATVAIRLSDPEQVARSKQFPFRFLSAYRATRSLNWGPALEQALQASLSNVPEFAGRTLVLVDRSGSMFSRMSERSEVTMAEQAAIFGTAVALRNLGRVDLIQYGTLAHRVNVSAGDSLLRVANERFSSLGGTNTAQATRQFYHNHDRVIVVTDEQHHDGAAGSVVPERVPVYTFNLAGYRFGGGPSGSGNRHTFGGLTDAAFRLPKLLEAGASQQWPWEQAL